MPQPMNLSRVATLTPRILASSINIGAMPIVRPSSVTMSEWSLRLAPKYRHQVLSHSNVWNAETSEQLMRPFHCSSRASSSTSVRTTWSSQCPFSERGSPFSAGRITFFSIGCPPGSLLKAGIEILEHVVADQIGHFLKTAPVSQTQRLHENRNGFAPLIGARAERTTAASSVGDPRRDLEQPALRLSFRNEEIAVPHLPRKAGSRTCRRVGMIRGAEERHIFVSVPDRMNLARIEDPPQVQESGALVHALSDHVCDRVSLDDAHFVELPPPQDLFKPESGNPPAGALCRLKNADGIFMTGVDGNPVLIGENRTEFPKLFHFPRGHESGRCIAPPVPDHRSVLCDAAPEAQDPRSLDHVR